MTWSPASVILTVTGLTHFAALAALSLPGAARALTDGDATFLVGAGSLYLLAAYAVALRQRWGRWLGLVLSGVEAIPGAVLLYVVAVFSADPGSQGSPRLLGFLALLASPLVTFFVVWRHRTSPGP